jgi:uncharacterized membrane protein YhdT
MMITMVFQWKQPSSYEIPSSTMFYREYTGYEPLVNWDARPSGEQLGYEKLDFGYMEVDTWKDTLCQQFMMLVYVGGWIKENQGPKPRPKVHAFPSFFPTKSLFMIVSIIPLVMDCLSMVVQSLELCSHLATSSWSWFPR